MIRRIATLSELEALAIELVATFGSRQLVLLGGPMGVGKTQLVRYIVGTMGGTAVMSPTFAIHNRYQTSRGHVDHVDLYRLEKESELEATGFWDLFAQEQSLIIVEWADRLDARLWPLDWPRLEILMTPEASGVRFVEVRAGSGRVYQ